jgi:hypothetical protein
MKVYSDIAQGTAEWFAVRAGKVTASELDNLLTPKFAIRTGEMPKSYLCKKIAEAHFGGPLPDEDYSGFHTENGQIREEEARKFYVFNFDHDKLTNAGFVEHDDGRFGGSPDALLGDNSGLEIKSPMFKTHVKYLMGGVVPDDYIVQVHGLMYATGRTSWEFMSYARKFPPLLVRVERDEEIIGKISEALAGFYEKFDAAMEKLKNA